MKSRLDQFYTKREVAAALYRKFLEHFEEGDHLIVEPSAGDGAFFEVLPPGSIAFDKEPRAPGIKEADFLSVTLPVGMPIAVIGNPPFGRNSSLAVAFFNHAAWQADVIAMILPKSFRKASIENRLDRSFHLLREEPVPRDAFLLDGRTYRVSAVFQIWVRWPTPRPMRPVATTHTDFECTTRRRADFAIQRVGARAGRVHRNFTASPNSHYFIRCRCKTKRVKGCCRLERVMATMDLAGAAADATGNPSLAKSEVVSLYAGWLLGAEAVAVAAAWKERCRPVPLSLARASRPTRPVHHRPAATPGRKATARRSAGGG